MDQAKVKRVFKEWILPFAIEILVVFLLIKFVFFFATVPTGSMIPTINKGDWLFTLRMYNPEENIQRGDILVFESDELGETLIKRVIGLPGDIISLDENGVVTVNGTVLDEPYVDELALGECDIKFPYQVPENRYFVLGDHRATSIDSRSSVIGCVEKNQIVGKVFIRVWPLSSFSLIH